MSDDVIDMLLKSNCYEPNHGVGLHVYENQMDLYDNGLRTFNGYKHLFPVEVESLANAGFHYTGIKDRVKCAYCKKEIENWEAYDEPFLEHRRISPNC